MSADEAPVPEQPLVLVDWVDASGDGRWGDPDRGPRLAGCLTTGWVMAEDEDTLLLAGSVSSSGSFGDWTSIPRCSVRRIMTVRVEP